MVGININCRERDFVSLILSGRKMYETRRTHSLRPYVGTRVGLVRTGCGRATLEGYAVILSEERLTEDARKRYCGWDILSTEGTSYETNSFAYRLALVERCEPREVKSFGIVARKI